MVSVRGRHNHFREWQVHKDDHGHPDAPVTRGNGCAGFIRRSVLLPLLFFVYFSCLFVIDHFMNVIFNVKSVVIIFYCIYCCSADSTTNSTLRVHWVDICKARSVLGLHHLVSFISMSPYSSWWNSSISIWNTRNFVSRCASPYLLYYSTKKPRAMWSTWTSGENGTCR